MAAVSNKKHLSLSCPVETRTFFSGTRPLRPPFRCHATQKLGNSNVYDNKAENPIKPKHDLFVVLAKCARFFFLFFISGSTMMPLTKRLGFSLFASGIPYIVLYNPGWSQHQHHIGRGYPVHVSCLRVYKVGVW